MSEHWIGIFEAARIVQRPTNYLRRADRVLQPLRDHQGRRVYSRLAIERFAAAQQRQAVAA